MKPAAQRRDEVSGGRQAPVKWERVRAAKRRYGFRNSLFSTAISRVRSHSEAGFNLKRGGDAGLKARTTRSQQKTKLLYLRDAIAIVLSLLPGTGTGLAHFQPSPRSR